MPQQEDERISGALQENLLVLLCFDDAHCKIIRGALTPHLFESSVYREVAGIAIDFIDQYGEAVKEHLPDHLEGILKGDDARKAKAYERLLENLYVSRDSVNAAYVVTQLHKFVRLQHFKSGLVKAVEAVQDGRVDDAELAMVQAMKSQAVAFDAGLDFSKPEAIGAIFDKPEEEGFELGIPEFDSRGIYPRRKELFSLLAPRKRGKSWFITHCAKQALLQRWSVLVITLELSESAYGGRMLQAFFSISKRKGEQQVTRLVRDRNGDLEGMIQEKIDRMSMQDPDAREKLQTRARKEFRRRKGFKIKGFPMHSLTMSELEAYLDGLERFEGFTPDAILVDYPRLMKHDAKNLRIELGQTFGQLRGIGQKRNAAVVIVHQTNRASESASLVTADMAEEDISIIAAVDVAVTFSQTKPEKKLGLARLTAEYVRNAESHVQVLITQAYAVGQFCLDSQRIGGEYWDVLDGKRGGSDDDGAGRRRRRVRDDEGEDEHARD